MTHLKKQLTSFYQQYNIAFLTAFAFFIIKIVISFKFIDETITLSLFVFAIIHLFSSKYDITLKKEEGYVFIVGFLLLYSIGNIYINRYSLNNRFLPFLSFENDFTILRYLQSKSSLVFNVFGSFICAFLMIKFLNIKQSTREINSKKLINIQLIAYCSVFLLIYPINIISNILETVISIYRPSSDEYHEIYKFLFSLVAIIVLSLKPTLILTSLYILGSRNFKTYFIADKLIHNIIVATSYLFVFYIIFSSVTFYAQPYIYYTDFQSKLVFIDHSKAPLSFDSYFSFIIHNNVMVNILLVLFTFISIYFISRLSKKISYKILCYLVLSGTLIAMTIALFFTQKGHNWTAILAKNFYDYIYPILVYWLLNTLVFKCAFYKKHI